MRTGRNCLVTALAALAFTTALTTTGLDTASAANAYCGALAGSYDPQNRPSYQHVVVLMEENVSYNQFLATAQMPFFTQLANSCASATDFHAATHPSQPNYMAATSGVATAVGARTANDNIFRQVQGTGTRDGSDQNLYSLLGTTEDILGLPHLGRAVGQPSMRPGMRF